MSNPRRHHHGSHRLQTAPDSNHHTHQPLPHSRSSDNNNSHQEPSTKTHFTLHTPGDRIQCGHRHKKHPSAPLININAPPGSTTRSITQTGTVPARRPQDSPHNMGIGTPSHAFRICTSITCIPQWHFHHMPSAFVFHQMHSTLALPSPVCHIGITITYLPHWRRHHSQPTWAPAPPCALHTGTAAHRPSTSALPALYNGTVADCLPYWHALQVGTAAACPTYWHRYHCLTNTPAAPHAVSPLAWPNPPQADRLATYIVVYLALASTIGNGPCT